LMGEAKLNELSPATMQRAADKRLSNMKAADKKYDSLSKKLDKDRYSNQMHHKLSPEKQKSTQAAADKAAGDYQKNYIGTNKDFGDGGKRAAAYAKRGITPKAKGSRKAVGTNEAKGFDDKFRAHLKFATSKSPAVQAYMKKRAAARDAMNKELDPNAAKKGYALSAVPPERAFGKARKKGMSAADASQAVGTASRNRGRKLPK